MPRANGGNSNSHLLPKGEDVFVYPIVGLSQQPFSSFFPSCAAKPNTMPEVRTEGKI
jgi:hypothetical protein